MLTGIILCGGKSTRMGTDKGLILKDGKSWVELAYQKLTSFDIPTKISINPSQIDSYEKLFSEKMLIVDSFTIPGPLCGVLSAHAELNKDLLLVACDMADLSIETIQTLVTIYNTKKHEYDFFVYKNEGEYEPLLGIYCCIGLQKVRDLVEKHNLKKYSMKYILDIGNTFSIELQDGKKAEFRNYNSL